MQKFTIAMHISAICNAEIATQQEEPQGLLTPQLLMTTAAMAGA